jgi:transcriptional regulator
MDESELRSEIYRQRHDEKKTLREIASFFGKSIYWVNSRLNKKYEPTKTRQTISDIENLSKIDLDDICLSEEVKEVYKLRKEGLKYEEIASKLNRSIYWVHSRLEGKYAPKGRRAEKNFQEERVVPFLINAGHTGIMQYVRTSKFGITQEADIISSYNNIQVITEVKISIDHHQIQTAVGQLTIHRFTYDENALLQLAIPNETDAAKLPVELIHFFEKNGYCKVLRIP